MFINILKAIIFGIVEGITEWLPVSSTGHLILVESFVKFKDLSEGFFDMFDVVIQFGAIVAVIILFFKNIWPIECEKKKHGNGIKLKWNKNILSLWGKIIVACIPAAVIGLAFDDFFDAHFYNPTCIAIMLILVGVIFIIVETIHKKSNKDYRVNSIKELTYKDAIIIGLFQVIAAMFPGTSRSGATIIGALLIGVERGIAAEYTFYLAIPVMFGASLLKIVKYVKDFGMMASNELIILLVGMIVAFLVSMVVIKFFMGYIKKHDFKVFGYYRIALGILVIILLLAGVII